MILGGCRWSTLSIHSAGRLARAARFSGQLSHFVSKRPIWLSEAAEPVITRSPTTGVAAQPIGVVHILVAGKPSQDRLPQGERYPIDE